MYCSSCNSRLVRGQSICDSCGTRVSSPVKEVPVVKATNPPPRQADSVLKTVTKAIIKKKRADLKEALILAGILFGLVLWIYILLVLFGFI